MRYYDNYEFVCVCTTAYIRTCSLHKYDEYLNCVSYTVTSATICVCVCVSCCVSCEGQPLFSLSPSLLFHFLLLHHLQSAVPSPADAQQDKKVCCFSLAVSICLSPSSNQSMSSPLSPPPPPRLPPSPCPSLVSPLLSTFSLAPSSCLRLHLLARSLLSRQSSDSYMNFTHSLSAIMFS